jgi:lipid-A-disaccharide synthase-like uncharacterized protein
MPARNGPADVVSCFLIDSSQLECVFKIPRLSLQPHSGNDAVIVFKSLFSAILLCLSATLLHAGDLPGRPVEESQFDGPVTRFKVELAGAKDNVKLAKLKDGSTVFVVKRAGAGTDRMLTPSEFAAMLYEQRSGSGWLETLFNITSPAGIVWVLLGLGGQLLFSGRMLVQWISSEKSQRSVIPISFWWMSLIGATMLLVYFIWRRDIVGILGQATGWLIYIRNLVLIRKAKGA